MGASLLALAKSTYYSQLEDVKCERVVFSKTCLRSRRSRAQLHTIIMCGAFVSQKFVN